MMNCLTDYEQALILTISLGGALFAYFLGMYNGYKLKPQFDGEKMKSYEIIYTIKKSQIIKANSEEEAETKFTNKHSFGDGYEVILVSEF